MSGKNSFYVKMGTMVILIAMIFTSCGKNVEIPQKPSDHSTEEPVMETENTEETEPSTDETMEPVTEDTTAAETPEEETPEQEIPEQTEESTQPEKSIEIECVLEPLENEYFIFVDELVKEDDYYVITGVKKHTDTLLFNNYQKSLLDAGAVMNVIYEEEKIASFTANVYEEHFNSTGSWEPVVRYKEEGLDGAGLYAASFQTAGNAYIIEEEVLAASPYNGLAFYFRGRDSGMQYLPVLEVDCQIKVSGTVMIDTLDGSIRGETMTMEDFYEAEHWIYKIRIYEEKGEVVKIEQWYVP